METNRKILKVGVGLIVGLVIIGCVGIYLFTISEPVMLEHYIEEYTYFADREEPRQIHVELRYITNADDERMVGRVHFPEHPDLIVPVSEFGLHEHLAVFSNGRRQTPGNVIGRYSLRTAYLEFTFDHTYLDQESIEITKGEFYLSDGTRFDAEIGIINFNFVEAHSDVTMHLRYTEFSEQLTTEFTLEEEIELVGIESEFLPELQGNIEISINGMGIEAIEGERIQEGEPITIESTMKSPNNPMDNFRVIKINSFLRYIRESGEEEASPLMTSVFQRKDYNFIEILSYLRERGKL